MDLGFISMLSRIKDDKNGIHIFPASPLAVNRSCEEKSTLLVFLGKIFNELSPFKCGRQMMRSSSLPIMVAQYDKKLASKA